MRKLILLIISILIYPAYAAEPIDLSQNYAPEIVIPGYTPEKPTIPSEKIPENANAPEPAAALPAETKSPATGPGSPTPSTVTISPFNPATGTSAPPPGTTPPPTGPQPASKDQLDSMSKMLAQNAKKLWGNFFISLSTCSPGLFVLPQVNTNLAKTYSEIETIEVKGIVGNKCKMSIIYYKSDDPRVLTESEEMKGKPIGLQCEIGAETIKIFILQSYAYLETTTNGSTGDPLSGLLSQQCQPLMGPLKKQD